MSLARRRDRVAPAVLGSASARPSPFGRFGAATVGRWALRSPWLRLPAGALLAGLMLTAGPLPRAAASRDAVTAPSLLGAACTDRPGQVDDRLATALLGADPLDLAMGCLFPADDADAGAAVP